MSLFEEYENLLVLAVDRDGGQMGKLADVAGDRFVLCEKEITNEFSLSQVLRSYLGFDAAHVVIGKKALHELPRSGQPNLIATALEALVGGGHLVLFLDSPDYISQAAYEELQCYKRQLLDSQGQMSKALGRLRKSLIERPNFGDDLASRALFSNLWVHLKDWAHDNEHELRNRYFSSIEEIEGWVLESGGVRDGPVFSEAYTLSARMFNETGLNQAALILDQAGGSSLASEDIPLVRAALEGDARHQLFCEFAESHLWDQGKDRPTQLGEALKARKTPLSFRMLHSALRERRLRLPFDHSVEFEFRIHVASFSKNK